MKKCAYWVSLRGASASDNDTGKTIRLPKNQVFDTVGLADIGRLLSRNEIPCYEEP